MLTLCTAELWLHVVTPEEIADVERAIEHYKSLKLPFSEINQSTFPLTVLKTELDHVVQEVHHGLGVRVLRGLPAHKWDRPVSAVMSLSSEDSSQAPYIDSNHSLRRNHELYW